ncbi:MAG: biotin--[acetyl-CoA-carboxylase] ligase [Planctomycetaceae bacterium]
MDLTRLQAETFLRGAEHHVVIDSTNNRALELCPDVELRVPYLVLADQQTSGRGRGANRWWSSDGALLFSVIVDANELALPESRWPQVSLTAGVTVCEMLGNVLSAVVGLKWPNDIWLNDRKVCGILVEVPPVVRGRLVIGIGLNVNNSFAAAPAELQTIATSLRDECGVEFDRSQLLSNIVRQLEVDLRRLAENDRSLPDRWRDLCVLRDRIVSLDTSQQVVTGRCLGIAADGALRLQTDSDEQRFYGGIVRRIA